MSELIETIKLAEGIVLCGALESIDALEAADDDGQLGEVIGALRFALWTLAHLASRQFDDLTPQSLIATTFKIMEMNARDKEQK